MEKTLEKTSGIYKIINKTNGKYYVGSSVWIQKRWIRHKSQLNKHHHINCPLTHDWHKHGSESFDFVIVEVITLNDSERLLEVYKKSNRKLRRVDHYLSKNMLLPAILLISEQGYLDIAAQDKSTNYQQCYQADGGMITEETRQKISASLKGRKLSAYHRERLRLSNIGRFYSEETRKKIGSYSKNRVHTDETKQKISEKSKLICHDKTVYEFTNVKTGEVFVGTRNDFRAKIGYTHHGIANIVKGKTKTHPKWKCSPKT